MILLQQRRKKIVSNNSDFGIYEPAAHNAAGFFVYTNCWYIKKLRAKTRSSLYDLDSIVFANNYCHEPV